MSGRGSCRQAIPSVPAISKVFLTLGLFVVAPMLAPGQSEPDSRPLLPPVEPKKAVANQKYQIPGRDRAIFQGRKDTQGKSIPHTGVVDFAPFVPEKENPDEYGAWHEVVRHASEFSTEELEAAARRDMTRDDLLKPLVTTRRLELLRFNGKLIKLRRVAATRSLEDAGVAEVYEARIVPWGEPATEQISIVFTQLPESLKSLRQIPQGEWKAIEMWVRAAGYFFKIQKEAKEDPIPVLVGKSMTVLPEPPSGLDRKKPLALDKSMRVFQHIRDSAPMAREEDNWEEVTAWNRVLLHARQFSPEELEESARADLDFADLFKEGRRDYKLELVKIEGRLISLKKMEPSKKLRDAGIEAAYEGWIVPKDEPRGNPISVVFTELPDGLEANGPTNQNQWVTFAGYSFKLLLYESGERDRNDPQKNVWKKAPLLLGRTVIVRPDPDRASAISWQSFASVATVSVVGLIGLALGLSWLFRRGDRQTRQEIQNHRSLNPFSESDH